MGLRGELPKLVIETIWRRGGQVGVEPAEADFLTIAAIVEGESEQAGWIEIERDEEVWTISDIRVVPRHQRRGIASHLLFQAHDALGSHFDQYELHHNERLEPDGLAWAMSVDGGSDMHHWESANRDRIDERFDDGLLAAEHDRHLQQMAREDPDSEAVRRALMYRADLPDVDVPVSELYVDAALADRLDEPSDEELLVVRRGGGMYEDEGQHYWVVLAGADKLRGALHERYGRLAITCQVTSLEATGLAEPRDVVAAERLLARPELSDQAEAASPDISPDSPSLGW
jgi:hypothetical protein